MKTYRTHPLPATRAPGPRRRHRGFTLLEIVIAVTIVAIIAAAIAPRFIDYIGDAKNKRAKADASTLAKQVELYMTKYQMSTLPVDFSLDVLAEGDPPMLKNRKQLLDPWGRPFAILIPGRANYDFDVVSFGEDGESGSPDDLVNGQE